MNLTVLAQAADSRCEASGGSVSEALEALFKAGAKRSEFVTLWIVSEDVYHQDEASPSGFRATESNSVKLVTGRALRSLWALNL